MDEIVQKNLCFGCSACEQKCPVGAISMVRNKHGFLYPVIDNSKCINCGKCRSICPALNNKKQKTTPINEAYAVRYKDSVKCASGGAFYAFANTFNNMNEYIAGTVWNEEFIPETIVSEKETDIKRMLGSKYVNGGTGNSFSETLKLLKKNSKVLFSGTPCQIAGLYAFLGKDYDNLITVEILCHGGGSPLAWTQYINYANKKYNKKIIDSKTQNTKGKITLYFEDGTNVVENIHRDNEYTPVYMDGRIKRDCCCICPFMGRVRNADIIIGDIWAKWASKEREKGISLVILNSQKGKWLFNKINWDYCEKFDLNSKNNDPLNKINNNIPAYNTDRETVLSNFANGMDFINAIKNRKVGLMNFNYPRDNYGALLLAYAMEKIVKKMGYIPCTINYYKNPLTMDFNPQGAMWKFREKYLNLYGFAADKEDLLKYNDRFNIFIFGSDIIWKDTREYVYFADWIYGNKNLIAYAASFCENKLPKADKRKKLCMQRFSSVSVREKSGIDICKQYANVNAEHVIDPSLLLDAQDYQNIIDEDSNTSVPKGDYLVYYTFGTLNPYAVNSKLPIYNLWKNENDEARSFGQWLNLIKNCKCVISQSFHGVCFSILYNKPFFYIKKTHEDNERVNSLLKKLGIDDSRIVLSEDEINDQLINKKIDYQNVNLKLKEFREFSYNWLFEALNKDNQFIAPMDIIKENSTDKKKYNILGIKVTVNKNKIKNKIIKMLSCFIFNKKRRKKFKNKYIN